MTRMLNGKSSKRGSLVFGWQPCAQNVEEPIKKPLETVFVQCLVLVSTMFEQIAGV